MLSLVPESRILAQQGTAVRRAVLAPEQLTEWVPQACAEVAAHLHHRGAAPCGFPFARIHPLLDNLIEVEAGFPIATPILDTATVGRSTLPGGPAVVAWYTGPHEKIGLAQHAIDDWLQTEPAARIGDSWEVYHDLPSCDQVGSRIEVVQPIALPAITV
jgi:effector-binding domain-containing protein